MALKERSWESHRLSEAAWYMTQPRFSRMESSDNLDHWYSHRLFRHLVKKNAGQMRRRLQYLRCMEY